MNKKYQLSSDLLVLLFRAAFILIVFAFVTVIFLEDYFVAVLLLFPLFGWGFGGKLFQLKSVSFDKEHVFIGKKVFPVKNIQKVEFNFLSKTYIQIGETKYYFISIEEEFGLNNKKEILQKFIEQ
ncbi:MULTISPECIES: hypothetical protein [Bacteria]|uniref:hypothetical protein n=1 Tax=Bacteria TaxID=2 RepID=UPI00363C8AA3